MRELTSETLRQIVLQGNESDHALALSELRSRCVSQLLRRMPNPLGSCPHGKRVEADNRGAYSSGYPIHLDADGKYESGWCQQYDGIVWDAPTPRTLQLRAMLDSIRAN